MPECRDRRRDSTAGRTQAVPAYVQWTDAGTACVRPAVLFTSTYPGVS